MNTEQVELFHGVSEINNVINGVIKSEGVKKILLKKDKSYGFYRAGIRCSYYIISGRAEIYSEANETILEEYFSPCLVGLGVFKDMYLSCTVNIVSGSEFAILSNELICSKIEERNLWRAYSELKEMQIYELSKKLNIFVENDVYNVVKHCLDVIGNYSDEERKRLSVINYILKRHNISRSSIYRILKELVKGKYIELQRGKLVRKSSLPERF